MRKVLLYSLAFTVTATQFCTAATISEYELMIRSVEQELSALSKEYQENERKHNALKQRMAFVQTGDDHNHLIVEVRNIEIRRTVLAGNIRVKQNELEELRSKIIDLINEHDGVLGISWDQNYDSILKETASKDLLHKDQKNLVLSRNCFGVPAPLILEFSDSKILEKGKAWVNYKKRVNQADFDIIQNEIMSVFGEETIIEDGKDNFLLRRIWETPSSLIDHRVEQDQGEVFHSVIFTRVSSSNKTP